MCLDRINRRFLPIQPTYWQKRIGYKVMHLGIWWDNKFHTPYVERMTPFELGVWHKAVGWFENANQSRFLSHAYRLGFHIFVDLEAAHEYRNVCVSSGVLVRVEASGITTDGIQQAALNLPERATFVARRMRILEVCAEEAVAK